MKVAILTQGPEHVASTYFRALQHIPRLQQRGLEIDVYLPVSVVPRLSGPARRVAYFGEHAVRYVARGTTLRRRVKSYDAVFVQRGGYPMGPDWIVKSLDRFPGRVVLDLDDNVFVTSPRLATKSRAARWLYGAQQARYLLDRADAVIVSTVELDEALPGRRADMVLPTVPDVAGFPTVNHRRELPARVGWIGNEGNLIYLDPLRDVFERARHEGVAELEVLSGAPWDGPATYRKWRRDDEARATATYDIGIMPLPDTPYTRAKAGFKMLMYMGTGSAVIASPVGVNTELVLKSGAGILATSADEWDAAVRQLATDHTMREQMGRAGLRFIRAYADMDTQADVIVSALRG